MELDGYTGALDRYARELKEIEARLERRVAPIRERYERLGPSGLYALAAAEQREADVARDEAARRVHATAALAAQALGDQAAHAVA